MAEMILGTETVKRIAEHMRAVNCYINDIVMNDGELATYTGPTPYFDEEEIDALLASAEIATELEEEIFGDLGIENF